MLRKRLSGRGLLCLGIGALLLVPVEARAAAPGPAAGVDACKTWCLWDQPRFAGTMAELADNACKDFAIKSAANNTDDTSKVIFFYKQPGCQGKPFNPFGMKAKASSARVDAVSAIVKPPTR